MMWRRCALPFLFAFSLILGDVRVGFCADGNSSIAGTSFELPDWNDVRRVVFLSDYNTRIVLLGTTLLGWAAGMVGSFTLLRRRALMGDALSHATLPGIGLAFIAATVWGLDEKSLWVLLPGATLSGLLGVAAILLIRNATRLKEDTALGAILSVFFGAGMAILGVIQQMKQGHAAGLEAFIYGKTASMSSADAKLIATAAALSIMTCFALFKEFKLLCFDEVFAGSRGFPIVLLDIALMSLVVFVSIVGLQAVGLILMIALLVIPAAAARFWTDRMERMVIISGILGMLGGIVGAATSALFSKLPSGAMIVLVCTAFFVISMLFGLRRGVIIRWWRRWQLNQSIDRQHLLRAMYELIEAPADANAVSTNTGIALQDLLRTRTWSTHRLKRAISRAQDDHLVNRVDNQVLFTERGRTEAKRLTRQHRLWELYLITHADTATSRVDRDADAIEHVLEPEIVEELKTLLDDTPHEFPASPHELASEKEVT